MAFQKILPSDLVNKGVYGLPDAPGLSTSNAQQKFDQISKEVIIPKFNALVDEAETQISSVSGSVTTERNRALQAEGQLQTNINTLDAAAMKKSVYDSDGDGVVDNAESLNGHDDTYFATATALSNEVTRAEAAEALKANQSALEAVIADLANYYTKSQTYSQTEVNALVSAAAFGGFIVVDTLPTTGIKTNAIYLVPKETAQTSNVKDEYINTTGTSAGWELIGDTEIDLSDYVTNEALNTALANYVTTATFNTTLANYSTTSQMNTAINTAVAAKTEIDDTTTSASKTWSSNKISSELSNIEQDAEAWAVGQRGGQDVPVTDPTYHNNAKYYSDEAYSAKTDAETAQAAAEGAVSDISALVEATVFTINMTSGNLEYNDTNYTFSINTTTGNLEWEVN